jgi:hypothetical protein
MILVQKSWREYYCMRMVHNASIYMHDVGNIIGERTARAQCLVLSIEIFIRTYVYGHTFRKSMHGCNFSDVNRVCMPKWPARATKEEIAGVGSDLLVCWCQAYSCEQAAFGGSAFRLLQVLYSVSWELCILLPQCSVSESYSLQYAADSCKEWLAGVPCLACSCGQAALGSNGSASVVSIYVLCADRWLRYYAAGITCDFCLRWLGRGESVITMVVQVEV